MGSLATLPKLAEDIAKWFPELKGRSVAVADADITKENVPTLPLCMVALLKNPPDPRYNTTDSPWAVENIAIEFWFDIVKARRDDGTESPFYAYYDYDTIMRRLATKLSRWKSPSGGKVTYAGMDVEATPMAVIIQFVYTHSVSLCTDEFEEDDPNDGAEFVVCVSFTETR